MCNATPWNMSSLHKLQLIDETAISTTQLVYWEILQQHSLLNWRLSVLSILQMSSNEQYVSQVNTVNHRRSPTFETSREALMSDYLVYCTKLIYYAQRSLQQSHLWTTIKLLVLNPVCEIYSLKAVVWVVLVRLRCGARWHPSACLPAGALRLHNAYL